MKLYDVIRREQLEKGPEPERVPQEQYVPPQQQKPFSWKKIFLIGGAIVFLGILYVVGMKYVHASVVITERRIPFSLTDASFELMHEKDASLDRLSFQSMVVTSEVTREVYGSGIKNSSSRATGSVIFLNEYSKSKVTIKSGTVLTSAEGKKYTTKAAVTIPGYTMNGKVKVPGSSTVVAIVASDVGGSSNTTGTTFTVAGYSGASAKLLRAQSSGAITGGDAGLNYSLSEDEKQKALATLNVQLTEKLKRETRTQIPPDLVTFPELQFVSIDPNGYTLDGDGVRFPATARGTMVSYLISRDLLEKAIAAKAMSATTASDVSIPELGALTVEPVSTIPTDPAVVPETLAILISGEGTLITKAPLQAIKDALIGIPRASFTSKLATMPEVDTARFSLTPFWAPLFPSDPNRITVTTK